MRYAVVSDIHANWAALEAVYDDARKQSVGNFWCLGDIVGYGPDPVLCVRFLREQVQMDRWVLGNHDAGLIGLITTEDFNAEATEVLAKHHALFQAPDNQELWRWCQEHMTDARTQPHAMSYGDVVYVLVHACLAPNQYVGRTTLSYLYPWETTWIRRYGLDPLRDGHLQEGKRGCLLHGHTHMPTFSDVVVAPGKRQSSRLRSIVYNQPLPLDGHLMVINPGSVGQPRDGDRRAAYAIIDTDASSVEFRRVTYDFRLTQAGMQRENYPITLCERLSVAGSLADSDLLARVYRRTEDGLEAIA